MTVYSHSRLSYYEQCPQKYKLQYIDKVETEIEESVEAFLGSRVHETLEKLYRDVQHQKLNSLEELISFLQDEWKQNWSDDIVIVNSEYNQDNYLKMAKKYITDYYNRYKPFNKDKTVALEERILIDLDDDGKNEVLFGVFENCADYIPDSKTGFFGEIAHSFRRKVALDAGDARPGAPLRAADVVLVVELRDEPHRTVSPHPSLCLRLPGKGPHASLPTRERQ